MSGRRRWAVRALAVVAGAAAVAVGWAVVASRSDRAAVSAIEARLDAEDPGWRLADVWAAYLAGVPPDERNGATGVRAADAAGTRPFETWVRQLGPGNGTGDWLPPHEPNRRPPAAVVAEVGCVLGECRAAVAAACRLRHFPDPGGFRPALAPDVIGTLLPHVDQVYRVTALLRADAVTRAAAGDADGGLESAHACLNAGRAIGDEPFFGSTLTRGSAAGRAVDAAERVLALGEPAAGLDELRSAFAAEAEVPRLRLGARGDRAAVNELFENFRAGRDSVPAMVARYGLATGAVPANVQGMVYPLQVAGDHRVMLEEADARARVAAARSADRLRLAAALPPPPFRRSAVARLVVGLGFGRPDEFVKTVRRDLFATARLRAAACGLGCEGFRRRHGRWPAADELPGGLPIDPYTGRPMRYAVVPGGAVVWAVGPDGTDDGGNLSADGSPGTDVGFRLFDPDRRNLP